MFDWSESYKDWVYLLHIQHIYIDIFSVLNWCCAFSLVYSVNVKWITNLIAICIFRFFWRDDWLSRSTRRSSGRRSDIGRLASSCWAISITVEPTTRWPAITLQVYSSKTHTTDEVFVGETHWAISDIDPDDCWWEFQTRLGSWVGRSTWGCGNRVNWLLIRKNTLDDLRINVFHLHNVALLLIILTGNSVGGQHLPALSSFLESNIQSQSQQDWSGYN